MKAQFKQLLKNDLFLFLVNGVIGYIALTAVIMATLQIPSEDILDIGLEEIVMVFEGD